MAKLRAHEMRVTSITFLQTVCSYMLFTLLDFFALFFADDV